MLCIGGRAAFYWSVAALVLIVWSAVFSRHVARGYVDSFASLTRDSRSTHAGMMHACDVQARAKWDVNAVPAQLGHAQLVPVALCQAGFMYNTTFGIMSTYDVHVYINDRTDGGCPAAAADPASLVLDLSDSAEITVGNRQRVVAKSFVLTCSPHNVMSVPLPWKTEFARQLANKRYYFLTFVGTFYLMHKWADRLDLLVLDDPNNGIVVTGSCHRLQGEYLTGDLRKLCRNLDAKHAVYASSPGGLLSLSDTTFGLVPVGQQPACYRLAEMFRQDIIPVMVYPLEYVLPFADIIAWSEVSFRFTRAQIGQIVPTLRAVSHERIRIMRERIRAVAHLFDIRHIVIAAMNANGADAWTLVPDPMLNNSATWSDHLE